MIAPTTSKKMGKERSLNKWQKIKSHLINHSLVVFLKENAKIACFSHFKYHQFLFDTLGKFLRHIV
jgi:hypothetical protein